MVYGILRDIDWRDPHQLIGGIPDHRGLVGEAVLRHGQSAEGVARVVEISWSGQETQKKKDTRDRQ